jgi:hypothetical protein
LSANVNCLYDKEGGRREEGGERKRGWTGESGREEEGENDLWVLGLRDEGGRRKGGQLGERERREHSEREEGETRAQAEEQASYISLLTLDSSPIMIPKLHTSQEIP